jgi:hypothetical protein
MLSTCPYEHVTSMNQNVEESTADALRLMKNELQKLKGSRSITVKPGKVALCLFFGVDWVAL